MLEWENSTSVTKWRSKVSEENPELLKKAQEELNENPDRRDRDIQMLRDMVLGEKSLKSPTDDAFLLKFLRVRKFNVERAFKSVKQYYLMRNKFPGIFTHYCPSAIGNFFDINACAILPNRDQLGRRIVIGKFGRWEPSKFTPDEAFAGIQMCLEYALLEEETQVNGIVGIADMKHFGIRHVRHMTYSVITKFATIFQEYIPARFKSFHAIFQPAIFDWAFLLLWPFINKKIRSRLHFHKDNLKSLHEHIHPEFLPEDYGGRQASVETAAELLRQALLAREDEIVTHIANSGYQAAREHD